MNCEKLAHNAVNGEAELASNAPAEMQETSGLSRRAESWPEQSCASQLEKLWFPSNGSFYFR